MTTWLREQREIIVFAQKIRILLIFIQYTIQGTGQKIIFLVLSFFQNYMARDQKRPPRTEDDEIDELMQRVIRATTLEKNQSPNNCILSDVPVSKPLEGSLTH